MLRHRRGGRGRLVCPSVTVSGAAARSYQSCPAHPSIHRCPMSKARLALVFVPVLLAVAPLSAQLKPDNAVVTTISVPDIMAFLSHEGYTGAEIDEAAT